MHFAYQTHKDGSNLLPDELGWRGNVIVGKEMNIVLDIHNSQSKTNTNAEGTVIVDINDGQLVANDAWSLNEAGCLGSRRHGQDSSRC